MTMHAPAELIARYSTPVPRYTSYPTAPHFSAGIGAATYARWLSELPDDIGLSLYLHVPFCDRLCWFCGCHTKQTRRYEPVERYLQSLRREITGVAARLEGKGRVTAVHLGGGSPSMLSPTDIASVGALLRASFSMAPDAEISVEIDPNDMDEARYDAFAAIGVNRVSLGVQDFDPLVQAAINREQSLEQTAAVVGGMRSRGCRSVNIDMLYGLPLQTTESLLASLRDVLQLAPDRIATFGYAHVPWMKPHQRMIDEAARPGSTGRFEQAAAAAAFIGAHGYQPIGIDHFALPGDSLARAARDGRLHRNFQGYTTDAAGALLGFGASAIGQLPQGFVQNVVPTGQYQERADADGLATTRGIAPTAEDRARAYVIERLMCDFSVSRSDLELLYPAEAEALLLEMALAVEGDADGLVRFRGDHFAITAKGRPFARSIAAGFDARLAGGAARHSAGI